MMDPNANQNDARVRQQQYIRLALLLCMTMLLMDPKTPNASYRQQSGSSSSGSLRGRGASPGSSAGKESASNTYVNPKYEVLLAPEDTKDLVLLMNSRFPSNSNISKFRAQRNDQLHNVSGVYRGAWSYTALDNSSYSPPSSIPSSSVLGGEVSTLSSGNMILQLRSVPIHSVPDVMYVYGILKMYRVPSVLGGGPGLGFSVNGNGASKKSPNASASSSSSSSRFLPLASIGGRSALEDVVYPVQGLFVPRTSECVLAVTPSHSHRVYISTPSSVASSTAPAAAKEEEAATEEPNANQTHHSDRHSSTANQTHHPDRHSSKRRPAEQAGRARMVADEGLIPVVDKRQMLKVSEVVDAPEAAATSKVYRLGEERDEGIGLSPRKQRQRGRKFKRRVDRKLSPLTLDGGSAEEREPESELGRGGVSSSALVVPEKQLSWGESLASVLEYTWPLPFSSSRLGDSPLGEVDALNDMLSEVVETVRDVLGARGKGSSSLYSFLHRVSALQRSYNDILSPDMDEREAEGNSKVDIDGSLYASDVESYMKPYKGYDEVTVIDELASAGEDEGITKKRKLEESSRVHSERKTDVLSSKDSEAKSLDSDSVLGARSKDRDNNLFSIQKSQTIVPVDSFMKAVKREQAAREGQLKTDNKTRASLPFFYAERYPFESVKGLELLLVDVDHSTRSQQQQQATSAGEAAIKKNSVDLEKNLKAKVIPPSAIPGGLGSSTYSNSFVSFVGANGLSKMWVRSARCTFALRLAMGGEESHGVAVSSDKKKKMKMKSTGANSSDLPFQMEVPSSLYSKYIKKGNSIRQLQMSLAGGVFLSSCSNPLCSGRGKEGDTSSSSGNDHVAEGALTSNQFILVASYHKINLDLLESKLTTYALFYTIVCVVQCYLLIKQMMASSNPAAASRISILSISAMAVLDAAICVLHLLLSSLVAGNAFYYFLWLSFLKLIIFCILEMRLVISIYQARYSQEIAENGWNGLRNHLATLHARFYGALFLVILLVDWYYTRPSVLVVLLYSFWVPQIAFSAYTGGPAPALSLTFSTCMTLTRLFFPLYMLACPHNFISMLSTDKFSVSYASAELLLFWMGLQLFIVYLQHKLGVRFFVPQYFLPARYNYSRSIAHLYPRADSAAESGEGEQKECVICYNVVDRAIRSRDYMVTPCDHLFHRECLSQWMEVKLECPVCRASLPLDEA